jgi:putative selenium metabolism protein SsnA
MKRLIRGVSIWDGVDRLIQDGGILIDGETIEAVFTREELSQQELPTSEEVDGTGKFAIPGLINAHTHLYSSLARGMAVSPFAPTSFSEILEQLWWRLDKALDAETVRISGLIGAMEVARCGVTTLIDHHASPNAVPGSLAALREAVCGQVGLRGAFCYETSDRDGEAIRSQGIAENLAFLKDEATRDAMSTALFGLHASFTLSDGSLSKVAEALPDRVGVHIHVAEGPEDEVQCVEEHGLRVVERLHHFGLLKPTSILAHCLHLDEAEKDLVVERDAIVIHNPRSNMNNAVGTFDLNGFLDCGILTGLGTDGLGTNMLGEVFTAGLLQKHASGDPLAGGFGALNTLLFENNPKIVERLFGVRVGRIAPGYAADIALLDYLPPTPLTGQNVLGHLLFGIAVHGLHVMDLFVAGRPILCEGRFVDLDKDAIYAQARDAARKLWGRLA